MTFSVDNWSYRGREQEQAFALNSPDPQRDFFQPVGTCGNRIFSPECFEEAVEKGVEMLVAFAQRFHFFDGMNHG